MQQIFMMSVIGKRNVHITRDRLTVTHGVASQLVSDRQSSPWSLVLTLAYMFAATITPAGIFHSLKLALLLSLASCSSKKVRSLPLLTITPTSATCNMHWVHSVILLSHSPDWVASTCSGHQHHTAATFAVVVFPLCPPCHGPLLTGPCYSLLQQGARWRGVGAGWVPPVGTWRCMCPWRVLRVQEGGSEESLQR